MPFDLPGYLLVQARFDREGVGAHVTADTVVNTFCFHAANSTDPEEEVRARLDEFYTTAAGGGSQTVRSFLSTALTGLTYNMRWADQERGTPGAELPSLTWGAGAAGEHLPPDCAACLSYRAGAPYTGRRRGRIYLGPLRTTAMNAANGTIATLFRGVVNGAALRLAESAETGDVTWGIASRAGNSFARIMEGYMDLHFDTQRRRDPGQEVFGRNPNEWEVLGA